MAEDDAKDPNEGAAAVPHDASLRLDPNALPAADQDFARMMGFGEEGQAPAVSPTTSPSIDAAPDTRLESPPDPEPDLIAESEAPTPNDEAQHAAGDGEGAGDHEPEPDDSDPGAPAREWDEIHPRPATLGRQSILIERAERVLALPPMPAAPLDPDAALGRGPSPSAPPDRSSLIAQLREREARIRELETSSRALERSLAEAERRSMEVASAGGPRPPDESSLSRATPTTGNGELEKALERMRGELDDLLLERDRLGDALAVANAARAEAVARAERLETAYRTARGPHGPVPEGERELRGEVIGLRRRLEEAATESRRLRDALDASATDLAIARAQGDDRQQELEQKRSELEALERDRASQLERLDESLARQRELLGLVSRIQAENVELRSTQAALEETLEARDLEISAREEHLLVTRRGLAARDAQLVEAEERLEHERHRRELVEAELERARLGQTELAEKLTRRDARIATLSKTLARVEDAIGRKAASLPIRPESGSADPAEETAPRARAAQEAATALASDGPVAAEAAPLAAANDVAPENLAADPAAATDDLPRPTRPAIFTGWRDAQVKAACGESNAGSAMDFLARRLAAHAASLGVPSVRVASLGGARFEAEVELVAAYQALAAGGIEIRVLDPSADAAGLRREAVEAAGQAEAITVEDGATAERIDEPGAHALLLVDATTGDAADEESIERLTASLAPDGLVLFADRLAGGPIELSAETSEKLAELWQVLPEAWTERPGFASPPASGDDGGSPGSAAAAFAALQTRYRPVVTIGFGHVADLFLGPARGFELAEAGSAAETLLASIDAIDESRSILESLPARHGVGVLVARSEEGDAEAPPVETFGLAWPEPTR